MSRFNFLIFCSLVLSSCSITDPYIDRKRNAGSEPKNLYVGTSSPKEPVVCYSSWSATLDEVKKLAEDECVLQKTGTRARVVEMESFDCTLFAPNSIKFVCY